MGCPVLRAVHLAFVPKPAAWVADARRSLHCLAVCSDAQVTKDSEDMLVYFYYV